MNAKQSSNTALVTRRVIIHDYIEPPQRVPIIHSQIPTLTHAATDLGVALVAAQPFARPAQAKLQRSRVLARRPVAVHAHH